MSGWISVVLLAAIAVELTLAARDLATASNTLKAILAELERIRATASEIRGLLPESRIDRP